jgi:hypothetical protein
MNFIHDDVGLQPRLPPEIAETRVAQRRIFQDSLGRTSHTSRAGKGPGLYMDLGRQRPSPTTRSRSGSSRSRW